MKNLINLSLKKLKDKKIPNPHLDLKIILNYSSKINKEIFLNNIDEKDIDLNKFNNSLKRRLKYEPISKIVNSKSFWKYDFYVDQNVLDPRPESELIIEEAIKVIKNKKKKINIIDIGTGSGCLAICLAKEFTNSKVIATDISNNAIRVAKRNIKLHNCEKKISIERADIEEIKDKFDLIVSNPPYLSKLEYTKTGIEIRKYEPKLAFLGGINGLFFYEKFAKSLPKLMKSNAYLILEIGEKQSLDCIKIFKESGFKFQKKVKDLQKKDRILIFSKL